MYNSKAILLRLTLLVAVLTLANFIYEKTFWKTDLNSAKVLVSLLNARDSADIIYIGESSNTTYHIKDSCTKSISTFAADYFPSLILKQVQKEATHAGNYVFLIQHLKENSRVKTVIVTLNLRSFDASWINSRLETSLASTNVLLKNYPPLLNRFLLSLSAYEKKSEKEREESVLFHLKTDPLNFPYPFKYKTAHQWDSAMAQGGHLNADGAWDNKKIELACHYIKAYGFDISTETNPRIKDFDKIVQLCKEKNIHLVLNLMAENVQYADSLVGKDLVFLMKRNRDILMKRYNKDGTIVVDNLDLVCGFDYIDQNWTTEHYNQRGRMKIARNLANSLKQIYPDSYKEVKVNVDGCYLNMPVNVAAIDTASLRKSLIEIERRIRTTPEWLAQIKVKANQKKVSIDEMIKQDARYVFDTDPKSRIK